jgi:YggT family protein
MLQSIFYTASSLISMYSFVCIIRIMMSWIPNLEYSPVGRFIAGLCDPYLNWFKRFSFTRIGMVDFSPILALGLLSVGSMTFSTLAATGRITLGIVFAGILQVVWSFFSFLLNIMIVFLIIRLIHDLVSRYSYSQFWTMLDRFLNPPISKITRLIMRNRTLSYRGSLILTLLVTVAVRVGLAFGIHYALILLYSIPV